MKALICLLVLASSVASADDWRFGDDRGCAITAPPASLHLDRFYRKYCSASGIPIVGSAHVPDAAIQQAQRIVVALLAPQPAVRDAMRREHFYVMVLATSERTTDLPEERGQPDALNTRARGLFNATNAFAAEENMLCYERDNWHGENILVHEFGHALKIAGFQAIDSNFEARVKKAFDAAIAAGKYKGLYAGTNPEEYWAEGIQDYFDVHQNHDPNDVNTREQLAAYDPALYAILDEKFHAVRLPPACPRPAFTPDAWHRIAKAGSRNSLDDSDLRPTGNYSGQFWHLTPNGDGTFRLQNMYLGTSESLDVANDGIYAPVMAHTGNYSGQFWTITPVTTGRYRLHNRFRPELWGDVEWTIRAL